MPKRYPPDSKRDVGMVSRPKESSQAKVASGFGVSPTTLKRLMKQADVHDGVVEGRTTTEQQEVVQLRRDNRRLQTSTVVQRAKPPILLLQGQPSTYSLEEVGRVYSKAQEVVLGEAILFALMTGARQSEVIGLRWSDVSVDRSECFLAKRKNGSCRQVIPLPDPTLDMLLRTLPVDTRRAMGLDIGPKLTDDERVWNHFSPPPMPTYVFRLRRDRPVDGRILRRVLGKVHEAAGIDRRPRFHDLRLTWATLLTEHGV